ncbi:MAG: DUF2309 domain-containing protein [Nannocystaceae bacterium]
MVEGARAGSHQGSHQGSHRAPRPDPGGAAPGAGEGHDRLRALVDHAAHLLPAQGPISVFIHHNTLHAFEDMSFEAAVAAAGERLGAEPYLSEERFREELAVDRITVDDLEAVLADRLGAGAEASIAGLARRVDLWRAMIEHGLEEPAGDELRWVLAETPALVRVRPDLPESLRRRWQARGRAILGRDRDRAEIEAAMMEGLWRASVAAAAHAPCPEGQVRSRGRLAERVAQATGVEIEALIHPVMIRFVAAFLDQGIAYWPMPGRERGLWAAFREYAAGARGAWWLGELRRLAGEAPADDAWAALADALDRLGTRGDAAIEAHLEAAALALRGWAGMIHELERRPDRAPVHAPAVHLVDFLAAYLLAERAAIAAVAREHLGHRGDLAALDARLAGPGARAADEGQEARAFALFQVAQALVIDGEAIERLTSDEVAALFAEIDSLPALRRRELLHLAYERRHRLEILHAMAEHGGRTAGGEAAAGDYQAVFCIDEREESIRRHLEEVDPGAETFGTAGFFGVAMYYRGVEDAHPVPLCPIAIRPTHEVEEVVAAGAARSAERRARSRAVVGRLSRGFDVGTRTFARGTLLTAALGVLAVVPLVFRVLFPRFTSRVRRRGEELWRAPEDTRLQIERRDDGAPILGQVAGFTVAEQAAIVRRLLGDTGLARALSPLVLILGHGSVSLNNPHESAHDCGACGGGRGGPNARAFAQMANDPAVRGALAAEGVAIPAGTIFVGGIHNTCDEAVTFFDVDRIPEGHRALFDRARRSLDEARARNAHERCRRFDAAPPWLPPALALAHVEARSQDLAQVRPEYGHATNAVCVIGRRGRTRGLFLDRRAFLVSYDPRGDEAGAILAGVLGAVLPVCAGINLEYYFSRVDPRGYGCGTKLPHNITGLLGVMDGHQSDLRTGLPWQMVEVHEPVRLLVIVEAGVAAIEAVIAENAAIRRLVDHRWIQLAALDPASGALQLREGGAFRPVDADGAPLPRRATSVEWYRGRRDHLPCARIDGGGAR